MPDAHPETPRLHPHQIPVTATQAIPTPDTSAHRRAGRNFRKGDRRTCQLPFWSRHCVFDPERDQQRQDALTAVGRDVTSTWWQVKDPINPGGHCWVSADVTDEEGDTSLLIVVPAPFVTVTKVELRVEPNRIVVGCNEFPPDGLLRSRRHHQRTDPAHLAMGGKQRRRLGCGHADLRRSGTQLINEFYRINAPNEYWVKLNILTK